MVIKLHRLGQLDQGEVKIDVVVIIVGVQKYLADLHDLLPAIIDSVVKLTSNVNSKLVTYVHTYTYK